MRHIERVMDWFIALLLLAIAALLGGCITITAVLTWVVLSALLNPLFAGIALGTFVVVVAVGLRAGPKALR